jgi:hypothetical protein
MKINHIIKFKYLIYSAGCLFFLLPFAACRAADASPVVVTPSIIDEQAEVRDILEYSIKLKNNAANKIELYPFVNDLKKNEGEQPFINPEDLDKTVSLARWIEVSRAVIELNPGEEKIIPVKISINPAAAPGMYFAAITFGQGSNRELAEQNRQATNQPEVLLNIEIEEHVVEKVENGVFKTERSLNFNGQVNFLLSVKNIGNKAIRPKGSIIIYNRRGAEIGALPINQEQTAIEPQAAADFKPAWDSGRVSGRLKAKLELEYGDSRKDINDAIYFWVLPWQFLAIFLTLLLAAISSLWILLGRIGRHKHLLTQQAILSSYRPTPPTVINLKNKK